MAKKIKMKRDEFLKLWVEKLRSGEYKKGRMLLHTKDGTFCCLGVACDLYSKHVDQLTVEESTTYHKLIPCYVYNGHGSGLPLKVQKFLKMTSLGRLKNKRKFAIDGDLEKVYDLAELNDYTGLSFKQIADIIEEEFINEK